MDVEQSVSSCQVCGQTPARLRAAKRLHSGVETLAQDRVAGWHAEKSICLPCLNGLRADFVRFQMDAERAELSKLANGGDDPVADPDRVAAAFNADYDSQLSFGDRVSDKIAEFGGSWPFIFIFFAIVILWIAINSAALFAMPFDPFPFILLNLGLSLLAAIQAPVIMMSQNRQEERDRLQAENDYKINLRAEIEIRSLNEKMDQLLTNQWVRLLEIQQIQMEMLNDLAERTQDIRER